MIKFEKISQEGVLQYAPFFANQTTHLSDFSLGFQFMWCEYMQSQASIVQGCLVIKEVFEGRTYFHYPLSLTGDEGEEHAAITALEEDCRERGDRLHFTNVPRGKLPALVFRYGASVQVENPRAWRDYLYRADDFRRYAGGKYAGQRNHVNKFLKNYPDWSFRAYEGRDEQTVRAFLKRYAESVQTVRQSRLAEEELDEAEALLPKIVSMKLLTGLLFVGGELVGFTVGERCGDMVIVHVEKALREVEGAYPFLAQQFALHACTAGVEYLNRMDDAADKGLRKSKLQYLPCEVVDKFNVTPARAIDRMEEPITLTTKRLTVAPLTEEVGEEYRRLASNVERNKYWGYDYRADCEGEGLPSARWFLEGVKEDFDERREVSQGIYFCGKLAGEVVLHRFGYRQEAEIGARLLPEYEGRGFASEAIRAVADYAFMQMDLERIEAKCYRENERSAKMLRAAGFRPCGEDETFLYFHKTAVV